MVLKSSFCWYSLAYLVAKRSFSSSIGRSLIVINAYTTLLCEVEDQRGEVCYFFFYFSRLNGTSNDNGNNNENRGNA